MTNATPQTATDVALFLGGLSRELANVTRELGVADRAATHAREKYIMAYAEAFRQTSGNMDVRKQLAIEATHKQRLAAEEADSRVRDLRRQIDAIKVRIDVGRSYGAAVRSELDILRSPFQETA